MSTDAVQLLTHSRAATWRTCPRKAYLRYELAIRPEIDGEALRIGSAFARAVEADSKGLDVSDAIDAGLPDAYDKALVAAMFTGHKARWAGQELEHVAAELPFDIPLRNPATGYPTPCWRLAGKIDRIVRLADGRLALMEYKTTSRNFEPDADYWLALHMDMQLSIYLIAARSMGYDIATILYDVTRRPAQRPSAVPLLDADGVKIVHGPDGNRVRTKDGKKWRETGDSSLGYVLQTRQETPEEFAARVGEVIAADPDRHFARIEIARLDEDLDVAAVELWQQQLAYRAAQTAGTPDAFYRNPGACFGSSYTCEFLSICRSKGLERQTPTGFVKVDDVHPELAVAATEGGQPLHALTGASRSLSE